jgi:hypothetical protein
MAAIQYDVVINYVTKMNGKAQTATKNVDKQAAASTPKPNKNIEKTVLESERLNQIFGQMRQVEVFKSMGVDASKFNDDVDSINQSLDGTQQQQDKMWANAKKMSKGFDMSMLSFMFFGMFLQRIFGQIFSQMLNTFKMIDKKGTMPLSRSIARMSAAMQFLSFTIMRSMTPLLLPIIDLIVNILDMFASLPQPIQQVIGSVIMLGLALGTVLFLIGTISLGLGAIVPKTEAAALSVSKIDFTKLASNLKTMAWAAVLATLALLILNKTMKAFEVHGVELQNGIDRIGEAFDRITSKLGIDGEMIKGFLANLAANFDIYLTTGIAVAIRTFTFILETLLNVIDFLLVSLGALGSGIQLFFTQISGKDATKDLENFTSALEKMKEARDTIDSGFSAVSQDFIGMATTQGEMFREREMEMAGAKSAQDLIDAYTIKSEENLPLINEQGAKIATSTAEGFSSQSEVINTTIQDEYGAAMDLMNDITKTSVDNDISQIDRLISKLRQLRSEQAATNLAGSSSTTNNNKTNNNTINVSGNNTDRMARTIKAAVA